MLNEILKKRSSGNSISESATKTNEL